MDGRNQSNASSMRTDPAQFRLFTLPPALSLVLHRTQGSVLTYSVCTPFVSRRAYTYPGGLVETVQNLIEFFFSSPAALLAPFLTLMCNISCSLEGNTKISIGLGVSFLPLFCLRKIETRYLITATKKWREGPRSCTSRQDRAAHVCPETCIRHRLCEIFGSAGSGFLRCTRRLRPATWVL